MSVHELEGAATDVAPSCLHDYPDCLEQVGERYVMIARRGRDRKHVRRRAEQGGNV